MTVSKRVGSRDRAYRPRRRWCSGSDSSCSCGGQTVWRRVRGSAAGAVAAAFRNEDPLSAAAFRRAVAPGGGGAEAAEALEHLGFVWQAGGTPSWEPGIPSLMDYIVEHAPPAEEGGGAGG